MLLRNSAAPEEFFSNRFSCLALVFLSHRAQRSCSVLNARVGGRGGHALLQKGASWHLKCFFSLLTYCLMSFVHSQPQCNQCLLSH